MAQKGVVLVSLALVAPLISAAAEKDWKFDVNPGCGKTGLTRQQKIDRNYNMARHFHHMYLTALSRKDEKVLSNLGSFGCYARELKSSARLWDRTAPLTAFEPARTAPKSPAAYGAFLDWFFSNELRAYWKYIPDMSALPEAKGGFVAFPSEDGVVFSVVYQGHAKNDGREITYWETYAWKLSDAGQIVEWWLWGDTASYQDYMRYFTGDPNLDVMKMTPEESLGRYVKFMMDNVPAEYPPPVSESTSR